MTPGVAGLAAAAVREEGPMTAADLAAELASRGDLLVVVGPESVEEYERGGSGVPLVRGGEHRAPSAAALDSALSRSSCFERMPDGRWDAAGGRP